mgnify:CR=1 FL=1
MHTEHRHSVPRPYAVSVEERLSGIGRAQPQPHRQPHFFENQGEHFWTAACQPSHEKSNSARLAVTSNG